MLNLQKIQDIAKDWWFLGIWIGVVSAGVGWIISNIQLPALELTAASAPIQVKLESARSSFPAVGNFVVDYFKNFKDLTQTPFAYWIALIVGSIALVVLGRIAYEFIHENLNLKFKFGPTKFAMLAEVLLYGAIIVTLSIAGLGGMWGLTGSLLAAFIIYYIILALIVIGAARLFNFPNLEKLR